MRVQTVFRKYHERLLRQLSLDLAQWYRQLADTYGCMYINAADYVCASEADGVHLDADQHVKLGKKIAGIISEWFEAHPEFSDERIAMEIHPKEGEL